MTSQATRPTPRGEASPALLGDAIDALEAFQVPTPHAGLEDVIGTLRFVRDSLVRQATAKLGLSPNPRRQFAHPCGHPTRINKESNDT